MSYQDFLDSKAQVGSLSGFEPTFMPEFLFDFQAAIVEWAVRRTNKPVLVLTPLAVSFQTIAEADKFGIEGHRTIDGKVWPAAINVTNYERLHHFDPVDFAGVVCDESSILKSFDGARKAEITEFMRRVQYRLLDTATAAANDYIELGTSSEALGELGYTDMLGRFFKNDQGTIRPMRYTGFGAPRTGRPDGRDHTDKWRFKGHAEKDFWRWVSSWARAMRRPSDLGFDDDRFILPPLIEHQHLVEAETLASGHLFALPAVGLQEQREERRRTIAERCDKVVELTADTAQSLVWCHLNAEGDRLAADIGGAVQVAGSDSDEAKEERLLAFARGQVRVLVTKPKIGAWGLNLQSCAHVTSFPSHSFEQYYQGVRRCWRFGQTRPVTVDIVTTEGEKSVLANLQRKAKAADRMFTELVAHMNDALHIKRGVAFTEKERAPAWL